MLQRTASALSTVCASASSKVEPQERRDGDGAARSGGVMSTRVGPSLRTQV